MNQAFETIIGNSNELQETIRIAAKVASSQVASAVIIGETGTGKELFARAMHNAGAMAAEPFVAINCAAIPETLLESELFGHERGAFTDARTQKRGLMEIAGRGTLFLDELGELPLQLQPKLLRALEERSIRRVGGLEEIRVQCRVIAATNRDLDEAIERNEFRADLYYRLTTVRLTIPPLRDRVDDVVPIARHLLQAIARGHEGAAPSLSADAETALRSHRWPGNVRELKNVIEHAAILAEGSVIRPEHLLLQRRTRLPASGDGILSSAGEIRIPTTGKRLEEIEREAARLTLRITGGNRTVAARMLGISRPTLNRILRDAGIPSRVASDAA